MQLLGRLEIRSAKRITRFLDEEHVGRIASIDADGFPQVIPMNFVFIDGVVYMHSHTRGEKLDNISRNPRVGFEVDRELEFLPSYFFHPTDASLADTLYVSVVIKGKGTIVGEPDEKCLALNGLMQKYQPEGRYEPLKPGMGVLDEVAVIKVVPDTMRGKYKIGQHMRRPDRVRLAENILARGSKTSAETLSVMGFSTRDGSLVMESEPVW